MRSGTAASPFESASISLKDDTLLSAAEDPLSKFDLIHLLGKSFDIGNGFSFSADQIARHPL